MTNIFITDRGERAAPGRFAQKTVPPVKIRTKFRTGLFAQNYWDGTVRSNFNLQGQFTLFDFKKKKKSFEVECSSFLNK